MKSKLKSIFTVFAPLFEAERHERLKILLLSGTFAMIVGAYSILKSLKNPVFFSIVGKYYQPYTRFLSIPFLILGMMVYSILVDKMRRYQVLCFFTGAYAVIMIFFAYRLYHPVWGLSNTGTDKYRFIGWLFYLTLDFYQGFVLSSFWAFSNSVNTPDSAKKNYGFMVACSKIAGVTTPFLSAFFLHRSGDSNIGAICILIASAGVLLAIASFLVMHLKKVVPGYYLHGYEAVYKLEKEKEKKETIKTGVLEGIKLMTTQPYVFSIFILVFCVESMSAILEYNMNITISATYNNSVAGMSSFWLFYTGSFQLLGFFIALFGVSSLLKYLDVRLCLTILPIATLGLMTGIFFYPTLWMVMTALIILRALHYGFNFPIQEILYIPTTKDIKFKAQAWIKSFGRQISKTSGAAVNILSQGGGPGTSLMIGSLFSFGLGIIWLFTALSVGTKYTEAVKNENVIGATTDQD